MKLQAKLLVLFALVGAALANLLGLSSRRAVHSAMVADIQRPLRARGAEIALSMRLGLDPAFRNFLPKFLEGCVDGLRLAHAAALDPEGRVIERHGIGFPETRPDDPFVRLALKSAKPSFREMQGSAGPMLEVLMPVRAADGTLQGALLAGYSLQESLQAEAKISSQVFWHTGSVAGLALLFLLFYTRRLIAPLRDLARGADRIAGGEYGTTVAVAGRDEAGELAERFNEMSLELARTAVTKGYLDDILGGMSECLFVADAKGELRLANRAMTELLGRGEGEILGTAVTALFSAEEAGSALRAWNEAAAGAPVRNREFRMVRKNASAVPVLLSLSPLKTGQGVLTGVIGTARDVSDLKKREEELRGKDLELRQAEKLSSVGRLAAGIAHEINNPLGSILGFAQASLERVTRADPVRQALAGIEEEARRCRRLVRDLLAFSRRTQPGAEEFDLSDLVSSSLNIVEPQARVQGVALRRDLRPDVFVRGDRSQLQQVLLNLVQNALDTMPRGGELTLRARRDNSNDGARIILEVEDTGSGIAPELLDRIFEPFFTTKEGGRGTGLGLALARQIVANHQGTIEAANAPSRGSLFRVCLPAAIK